MVVAANRFHEHREARSKRTNLVRCVSALAEMYEAVDERGELPRPATIDPASAFLEPWRVARTQRDFFGALFKIPEGTDEHYLKLWTLTRGGVAAKGGPVQAASLAAADFLGTSSRSYFNAKRRPEEEQHELHQWLFWNREADPVAALRSVLELLGVEPQTAARSASVAFDATHEML
jgi:hypothetical protein